MKWPWTKPEKDPASGECQHSWSNWSNPESVSVRITSFGMFTDAAGMDRDGWAQDRHCLKCNIYERRIA